jgi:hypothetical protein
VQAAEKLLFTFIFNTHTKGEKKKRLTILLNRVIYHVFDQRTKADISGIAANIIFFK